MVSTAFVTGANGFVAKHVIKQLLDKNYKVIGSVRSEFKGEALIKTISNKNFSYVIIKDFEDPEAFSILKDHLNVTIFIHTASPVVVDAWSVEKYVNPAVKGTVNALAGIKKYGKNVTNFVLTSSVLSALQIHQSKVIDELDWADITEADAKENYLVAYSYSKKLAEQAAWKFIEDEKPEFTFSVILPSYVIGPQAFDGDVKETLDSTSEYVNSILNKGKLTLPLDSINFIDARDVAKAHIAAFERNLQKRFLLVNTEFGDYETIKVLKSEYPDRKYPEAEEKPKANTINADESKRLLGFEYISFEQSVLESAKQIETLKRSA